MKKCNELIFLFISSFLFSLIGCGSTTDNEVPGEKISVTLSMTIDKIDSHEVTSTIEVKAAGTGDLSVQDKGICYSQGVVTPTVSDEKSVYSGSGKNDFSSFKMKLEGLSST